MKNNLSGNVSFKDLVTIEKEVNKSQRFAGGSGEFAAFKLSEEAKHKYTDTYGEYSEISVLDAKLESVEKNSANLNLNFIYEHLEARGYVRKDGSIDTASFYKDAQIPQSVWSRYESQKQKRLHPDTLLKIVLGLRLNISEARLFLAMNSSGFNETDKTDRIIISYIQCDYLGCKTTSDIVSKLCGILDFYSEQEVKANRKPLRIIYKDEQRFANKYNDNA